MSFSFHLCCCSCTVLVLVTKIIFPKVLSCNTFLCVHVGHLQKYFCECSILGKM